MASRPSTDSQGSGRFLSHGVPPPRSSSFASSTPSPPPSSYSTTSSRAAPMNYSRMIFHDMAADYLGHYPSQRGGAGNLGHGSQEDFSNGAANMGVPHLKADYYTTGRGGNANMMRNSDPNVARMSQDVDNYAPVSSSADYYGGRGGAGNRNLATEAEREAARAEAEAEQARQRNAELAAKFGPAASAVAAGAGNVPVDHSKRDYRGWADKGKDLLLGRRK